MKGDDLRDLAHVLDEWVVGLPWWLRRINVSRLYHVRYELMRHARNLDQETRR